MNRPVIFFCALGALSLLVIPIFAQGDSSGLGTKARDASCYVIVEEGASAEGNALFLEKMGVDAEALSLVAPTRFSFGSKNSLTRTGGSLSYEADSPVLVERSGRLALYSVAFRFSPEPLPKALKTVIVNFTLADLARTKDAVQPAAKAIELAAAKARMKSGLAWIVEMKMPAHGAFRAKVGLAK
ncbi:MAG: hypothetical protein ABSF43_07750 [Rectinemataceae bacterium]